MATHARRPGEFCWINMLTPRPAEAMEFFGELLGWTFFEMPGYGHGMRVGGRNIGGLFDLEGPQTPRGTPPMIGVMVKVEDADRLVERAVALGGRAKPPFDIASQGRMAVCSDPTGAGFDVWQSKAMPGTDVDPALCGAPSWFEAVTTDVERATRFYHELFGWTPEVLPAPGHEYTVFKHGADPVAGLMAISPEMGDVTPHWRTYFAVADADETAETAQRLGGRLHAPMREIPGVGRFCGITSPQGVPFYIIRYAPRHGTPLGRLKATTAMTARGLTPILNVSDIVQSFAWFEKLGWTKCWDWGHPPTFGAVGSGTFEIFLCQDAQGGRGRSDLPITAGAGEAGDKGVWMSIWVDDVDAVYRHCLDQGLEVTHPPTDEPWGVREMHVRHPDGHVFRISKGIEKAK